MLLARVSETTGRVTIPPLHWPGRFAVRNGRLAWPDFDRVDATHVGRLLAASGTADIADAHVVVCARRSDQYVATSDPTTSAASITNSGS